MITHSAKSFNERLAQSIYRAIKEAYPNVYLVGEPLNASLRSRTTIDGEVNLKVIVHRAMKGMRGQKQ